MHEHFLRYACIKLQRHFGLPRSALANLYKHLCDFQDLRPSFPGYDKTPPTFFFNASGEEMLRMGVFMCKACVECSYQLYQKSDVNIFYIYKALSLQHSWCFHWRTGGSCLMRWAVIWQQPKKFYIPEATVKQAHTIRQDILRSLMQSVNPRKTGFYF